MESIFCKQQAVRRAFEPDDECGDRVGQSFGKQEGVTFLIDLANLIGAVPREMVDLIPRMIPSINEVVARMGARAIFVFDRECLCRLRDNLSDKVVYAKLSTQLRGENVVLTPGPADSTLFQLAEKMQSAVVVSNDRYQFCSRQFPTVGAGRIARFSVVRIPDVGLMFTVTGVREGIFLPFCEERAA